MHAPVKPADYSTEVFHIARPREAFGALLSLAIADSARRYTSNPLPTAGTHRQRAAPKGDPCRSAHFSRIIGGGRSATASGYACAHAPAGRSSPVVARRAALDCRRNAGSLTTGTSDVGRVLATGRAFHGNRVVLFVAPGTGKVAFVAGRRVGRAVLRNRARRIMRAAWRELAPTVPDGYDVALVARGTIQGARSRDLVTEVDELLSRARVTRS
jgi:ribonuclease P protein component